MAVFRQEGRIAWIEGPGTVFVVSDLHGNLRDFLRIVSLFEQEEGACLLFLGDLFHGPYLTRQQWAPYTDVLNDFYYDQSAGLFRCFIQLMKMYPDRVRAILGNHEHAHVGGPRVAKFTSDEAYTFESHLDVQERMTLVQSIQNWPWIVASRCGVSFTHGAPPGIAFDHQRLIRESLYVANPQEWSRPGQAVLSELLWKRSATREVVEQFLSHLNQIVETEQRVNVFGHEPNPGGYLIIHEALFNLSSSFAMRRVDKTYLKLNLTTSYQNAQHLEEQIHSLYDDHAFFDEEDDTLDEEDFTL